MKKYCFFFLVALVYVVRLHGQSAAPVKNKVLADSLAAMVKVDQIAANIPAGEYKKLSQQEWQHFKDSVFSTHQRILSNLFDRCGFPGYDLVGKEGAHHFWLMVQHCDKMPGFQEKILTAMKKQVDKDNAAAIDYAYLTDRVRLNTGGQQIYGTQVSYNVDSCQAYPRSLQDSAAVNARRKAIGMEPIEAYLNRMSTMHFEMNKEGYVKKGITKAKLYPEQ